MRDIIAVYADLHSNHILGVHRPLQRLTNGRVEGGLQNDAQAWLWDSYLNFIRHVRSKRLQPGDRVHAVFNGDLTDSPSKHLSHQIISTSPADMLRIGLAAVRPALDEADDCFVVAGTPAHTGIDGEFEEMIASAMPCEPCPETGAAVWPLLRMELQGVRLDFAHHGRIGAKDWTKTNQLGNLAQEVVNFYDYFDARRPDMVVLSHVHKKSDSYDNYPVRIITTPGFQLRAYYTYRTPYSLADIGGTIIVIENGEIVEVTKKIYIPEMGDDLIWRPQLPNNN